MTRVNHKAITISAIAAMLLIHSILITAGATASPLADVNVTNERQTLKTFGDAWARFEKNCADLDRKPSLTSLEFNSAKTSADELKRQIPQIQQTIRSVINKLKAAGQWDNFDSTAVERVRRFRPLFDQHGGAKRILEDGASQLGGLSQELEALVQPLGSKVRAGAGGRLGDEGARDLRSRVVRVSFSSPAPMIRSLRCMGRIAISTVQLTFGDPNDMAELEAVCKALKAACGSTPGCDNLL